MPALRAAVTAAHIAGSRRHSPLFNARSHWEIVRDWAGRHPDQKTRRLLESRATLGLLDSPSGPLNRQQLRVTTPELVAAAADALHRLLDAGDAGTAASLAAVVVDNMHAYESGMRSATEMFEVEDDSYPAWMRETIRARSWAYVANARLLADSQPAEALSELDRAERLAAAATYPEPAWPDWIPPDDLRARMWIEHGLIAPPDDLSVLDEREAYAAQYLDTIDGERLASLCLRIRLRHGVVDAATAQRREALDAYAADRVPTCTAHDLIPRCACPSPRRGCRPANLTVPWTCSASAAARHSAPVLTRRPCAMRTPQPSRSSAAFAWKPSCRCCTGWKAPSIPIPAAGD